MAAETTFLPTEHTRLVVDDLARFAARTQHAHLPLGVRERLPLLVADLAGVTVAGMRTPELRSLVDAWACAPGPVPLPGSSVRTTPETAAYLAATAACCLELDEGNKHAVGHPAAHVWFAAVAAAQLSERTVSGPELLRAFALGYEVAARFGRGTRRHAEWHTHGHWGATGAACAAALVLGADAEEVAAAVDATAGLMRVAPWANVLDGDFTRNLWIGGADLAGLDAARLARAGLVDNRGALAHTLGSFVGSLDPARVVEDLGRRWLVDEGYVKQHAACSYTHPAIDLVLALRAAGGVDASDVVSVHVRTHSLVRPLLARDPRNRLAAMFSLPFVVACALVEGEVSPAGTDPGSAAFAAARDVSDRVEVELSDELDAWLPDRRCTEVRLTLVDGSTLALAAPNPVGDVDHFPFGAVEVAAKLETLIGAADTRRIVAAAGALPAAPDVLPLLADLALAGP